MGNFYKYLKGNVLEHLPEQDIAQLKVTSFLVEKSDFTENTRFNDTIVSTEEGRRYDLLISESLKSVWFLQ